MRKLLVLAAVPLLLVVASCGSSSSPTTAPSSGTTGSSTPTDGSTGGTLGVKVAGSFGKSATATFPMGLSVNQTESADVITGKGAKIAEGDTVAVNYVGQIGRTGLKFDSSFDRGAPFITRLSSNAVIAGWVKGLVGKTVGSRVVLEIPPADGYGTSGNQQAGIGGTDTLVFVVDIMGKALPKAQGTKKAAPTALPQLTLDKTGNPDAFKSTKHTAKPPTRTTFADLVQGKGAVVKKGQTVGVLLDLAKYPAGNPVYNAFQGGQVVSFQPGSNPPLAKCIDTAIIGQHVGSRVLIACPGGQGFDATNSKGLHLKTSDPLIISADIVIAA
ncbi:MAG: FKBP-type peptidyl-prolyl cis-trans isomerase [Nocardioidaceae bacterium]